MATDFPGFDFKAAQAILLAYVGVSWQKEHGELMASPVGMELPDYWVVNVGAREFLEGDNSEFAWFDKPLHLVHKRTGRVSVRDYIDSFELLDQGIPVRL